MNIIHLYKIKLEFSTHYPESSLIKVLLSEPDNLTPEAFLAKVSTWLILLNNEEKRLEVWSRLFHINIY